MLIKTSTAALITHPTGVECYVCLTGCQAGGAAVADARGMQEEAALPEPQATQTAAALPEFQAMQAARRPA